MTLGRPAPPPLGKPLSLQQEQMAHAASDRQTPRSGMNTALAYGVEAPGSGLVPLQVERREPDAHDVEIAIAFCGLCHSDVHTVRGEWREIDYPLVPGHEIVGRVTAIGQDVTLHAIGDLVGVGCMVDSCRDCTSCDEGLEQYCEKGAVGTYGARDRRHGGEVTQGGYATSVVVDENFVLRMPPELDPAAAAPLLCAGITTYSPMRYFGVEAGDSVGVVGLGGLGHMAVKLAKAMGASVTVFTSSADKADSARALGADHVVVTGDDEALAAARRSVDLIIDTVSAAHDLAPFLRTIRRDGALIQLGVPPEPMPPVPVNLLMRHRIAYGASNIGGIAETQEMLDFCAEYGITADVELVRAPDLNLAYDRMVAGDVAYRFVLDIASLND
ncbi:NAD(P)-dependent alcohol dehydrogenase [Arthrobacter sp. CAU 1506]|uniref:NAD(P)-dependent alcohol dehydrogenase n=1 Tax=Arthrobacter sp. CAU 1506 TaxID=2560052 RepID=UPI0010ACBF45|nr:NAD(P)-dependent alcohol dehydrogenase [Arthrobacter sp. CAU 1506]TJY71204.1 NAD(P)-dependent alcohol dehydrogenase [Arthrobacter sp. CAU 1506]